MDDIFPPSLKILFFKTKESVIGMTAYDLTQTAKGSIITMSNPAWIIPNTVQRHRVTGSIVGETYSFRPFMGAARDGEIQIVPDMVLSIMDPTDDIIEGYETFIQLREDVREYHAETRDAVQKELEILDLLTDVNGDTPVRFIDDEYHG